MKIGLRNFGPIKEFDIDLDKDFHLLIGNNSIGKSYAITAIYLIIKNLLDLSSVKNYAFYRVMEEIMASNDKSLFANTDSVKSFLSSNDEKELEISNYVTDDIKYFLNKTFIRELSNSLINTFSSLSNIRNKFSGRNESSSIILSVPHLCTIEINIEDNVLSIGDLQFGGKVVVKKSKRVRSNYYGNETCVYIKEGVAISAQIRQFRENYSTLCSATFTVIVGYLTEKISGIHYLPASRSGLYQALSAFGQIIAELSRNRSFLSKKIELPGISEPVSDYFIKLSDIRVLKKNFEDKKLNVIAKEIEDNILGGSVEFNANTKQLIFSPRRTNLKLELSSTSSMVSELAPIVSYLRYVLTKPRPFSQAKRNEADSYKSLVMIEEPEAHLHPDVQIKLTEIFEKLIGADIKLIITTHSNFIFNKVNNLIIQKTALCTTEGMSKENVSSVVFKSSESGSIAMPMETDAYGILDSNFIAPTEVLFDEKMNLYSQIEDNYDDDEVDHND